MTTGVQGTSKETNLFKVMQTALDAVAYVNLSALYKYEMQSLLQYFDFQSNSQFEHSWNNPLPPLPYPLVLLLSHQLERSKSHPIRKGPNSVFLPQGGNNNNNHKSFSLQNI